MNRIFKISVVKYAVVLSTLLLSVSVFGRSPAVLDFVGISHKTDGIRSPQGTNVAYNFEQRDFSKYQKRFLASEAMQGSSSFSLGTLLGLLFIISLPFIAWTIVKTRSSKGSFKNQQESLDIISKYKSINYEAHEGEEERDKKAS